MKTTHVICRAAMLAASLLLAHNSLAVTFAELLNSGPPPESVSYKQDATPEQKLWVFPPADIKPGERRPAVVCIHGGAWRAGDADVFFAHARYFATRGAVGVSINYRLLKPDGPALADCLADCKSAIRYLRVRAEKYGIDPARIAVIGDSAGGHLAAALGTVPGFDNPGDDLAVSAAPNAMILCNPIVDMTEGSWIHYVIAGKALDRKPRPEDLVPGESQTKLARRLSPLFAVRAGQPPALMMHGEDDRIVSPEQARKFAAAMHDAGNRCDLEIIPHARHAFIITRYSASEEMVVGAMRMADRFLKSLGFLSGEPGLEVSATPAWTTKK